MHKRVDVLLILITLIISLFGLFMLYSASSYVAFRDFGDSAFYIKQQGAFWVAGIIIMLVLSRIDYHRYYRLAVPALITALVLLAAVFLPGIGLSIYGARRWINAGITTIQPAEFAKLGMALYLAAWFSNKEKNRLFAFLLLIGLVIGLIMLQPDMGTAAILLGQALIVYFISGASVRSLLTLLPVIGVIGLGLIMIAPYRLSRLTTFLDPTSSQSAASYHVNQVLIALGSGGLLGVGIGNSLQKYAYIPEHVTDSIFAIIAEEIGFLGSIVLIICFLLLVWRGLTIARNAPDMFGKLLAGGISSYLGLQIAINLAAQTALIPLTGVPLPFLSYGGSALISNFVAIGILLNISRQKA